MVETAPAPRSASLRRDAVLEAVAFAAERLLLDADWLRVVPEVLERFGRAAGASRASVMENVTDADGRACVTLTAEWCGPGIAPIQDTPLLTSFPWDEGFSRWVDRLGAGEAVVGAVDGFPPSEHDLLRAQEIVSLAYAPVTVEGEWWGAIGFDDCERARTWDEGELDGLRVAAALLGAAIARRRQEERLRQADLRYRTLIERIPAATYIDEPTGLESPGARVSFMSPQIESILGYPASRFVDEPPFWFSLIHPDDLSHLDEINAFDVNDADLFDHEYRMRHADGRWVWVHDTSTAVEGPDGTVAYFQGFMLDVTERREAQERVLLAEARYRTIVEHTPAITYQEPATPDASTAAPIQYVSPQIESILGYTTEQWLAPGAWAAATHPDDLPAVLAEMERGVATGEPSRMDYRVVAADGRVVWFHDESHLIRADDGTPLLWQGVMVDITERKEAEEHLHRTQERLQALIEHIPAVVYIESPDADPHRFYISPQVERIFGYTADEWTFTPDFWVDHLHPDDRERVLALDVASDRERTVYASDYRLSRADGEYVWVHDVAVFVPTGDGGGFWQGFMFDITERKLTEDRLLAAEQVFRATVEHLPAAIYREMPHAEGQPFYISPQTTELFGYPPDRWATEPGFWHGLIHPEDAERVIALDRATNETKEPYVADYRLRKADGAYIWVHDEATYVPDERGGGWWQGFMIDITQRMETEQQLREAEETFRTIVEHNPAVIYTQGFDPTGPSLSKTTYISPRQPEIFGYSVQDVLSDPTLWTRMIHPEDRQRVLDADVQSNRAEDDRFSLEYRMIAKDGRIIWVQDDAQLVRIEGRTPFWQGFLLDITERKQAEEQLARALEVEREATRRLRALDEMKNTFLQAVSHDLRTPLAAILGLAITLERGDVHLEEDDAKDLAGRIAGNARRLDRLVVNLLDLDRLARGIVTPNLISTDVGALVRRVVAESELLADSRLRTDIQPAIVRADAAKVERIVENLLANMARHTPPDATIWISVGPDGGGVLLVVEDDGPGVPEEIRETIFEPFRQGPDAPAHSPGVGVGLTLVRRFAELHGGRAWVEERDGGGASFRVFLPGDPPREDDGTPGGV